MAKGIKPADRAFQLEAYNLDQEYGKVLDGYVEDLDTPSISNELKLLLKFYVSSSYIRNKTTIGMKTFHMEIKDAEKYEVKSYKLILLTVSNLIIPYLCKRFTTLENKIDRTIYNRLRCSWLTFKNITTTIKILNLFNFALFLRNGFYLSLQERLLGVVPIIDDKNYDCSVSMNKAQMEFMSRNIIWTAMAEFITLMVPYVNTTKLKNQVMRLTGLMSRNLQQQASIGKISDAISRKPKILKCGICKRQPFNPYSIGCNHVYCYYCVQSKYLIDTSIGHVCPSCNYQSKDPSQLQRYRIHLNL